MKMLLYNTGFWAIVAIHHAIFPTPLALTRIARYKFLPLTFEYKSIIRVLFVLLLLFLADIEAYQRGLFNKKL